MHRRITSVVCVLAFSGILGAQEKADVIDHAVRELSQRYSDAICSQDTEFLGRILTDDYSHISAHQPDGDKTKFIESVTTKSVYLSHKCSDIRIRENANCVIETGRIDATFNQDGFKNVLKGIRYTRIWEHEGGNWYVTHEHFG